MSTPIDVNGRNRLFCGDMLQILPTFSENTFDSVVCDPPYGLTASKKDGDGGGFMGQKWDSRVPGPEFWDAILRVAKPGAHLIAFGGTRTFHRLMVAIEDAGWEIRDCLMWVYGSGFPKSMDVSKAIDKHNGDSREVVGSRDKRGAFGGVAFAQDEWTLNQSNQPLSLPISSGGSEISRQFDGWGTALKPAWEPIILARKPLIGTVAENVITFGTGGINIDGCRVGGEPSPSVLMRQSGKAPSSCKPGEYGSTIQNRINPDVWCQPKIGEQLGRFPANLIHDGSDEVLSRFPEAGGGYGKRGGGTSGDWNPTDRSISRGQTIRGGGELIGFGDSGSAARFFYCAKASRQDRDEGLDHLEKVVISITEGHGRGDVNTSKGGDGIRENNARANTHPTVKPTELMRYLCRLVTPKNGFILDPFMGSGSTGKAANLEGFRFCGVDLDENFVNISRGRIEWAIQEKSKIEASDLNLFLSIE